MVIRYQDIIHLLSVLSEEEGIKVSMKESGKGALVAGFIAGLGGLLLGPPGLAIGGTVGGCVAAYMGQGKFKPLAQVITTEMSRDKQKELVNIIKNKVAQIDASDALELVALVQGNAILKAIIVLVMVVYMRNRCNMKVNLDNEDFYSKMTQEIENGLDIPTSLPLQQISHPSLDQSIQQVNNSLVNNHQHQFGVCPRPETKEKSMYA